MHNAQEWKHADQAIEWIHSLLTLGIKPGLKRMEWMLERLGNPERRLKFIHVGGTNGKGSTVSYIRHVLQEAGFEVGSFTSPYLERFHNRIQINGQDISDEDLLQVAKLVKPLADELATTELGSPTEFEVLTTMAILYYSRVAYPDFIVWEVGLGGRFDSTNVVVPILSIITNVGYDHIHILGDKIEDIAFEKAGIIKAGVPVVTGVGHPAALKVIEEKAEEMRATLYPIHKTFNILANGYNEKEQFFSFSSPFAQYENLSITLKGSHQLDNAAVAVMALEVLKQYYAIIWDEEHLREGLRKTEWMGRFEQISAQPITIIDGAHNPEGMEALCRSIEQYYQGKKITMLFSAMRDKQIIDMLKHIEAVVDRLILTQFDYVRAAKAQELLAQIEGSDYKWLMNITAADNWMDAYHTVADSVQENEVIIITGSLYFISEVRRTLKK